MRINFWYTVNLYIFAIVRRVIHYRKRNKGKKQRNYTRNKGRAIILKVAIDRSPILR
jgi:hypothetical protein